MRIEGEAPGRMWQFAQESCCMKVTRCFTHHLSSASPSHLSFFPFPSPLSSFHQHTGWMLLSHVLGGLKQQKCEVRKSHVQKKEENGGKGDHSKQSGEDV